MDNRHFCNKHRLNQVVLDLNKGQMDSENRGLQVSLWPQSSLQIEVPGVLVYRRFDGGISGTASLLSAQPANNSKVIRPKRYWRFIVRRKFLELNIIVSVTSYNLTDTMVNNTILPITVNRPILSILMDISLMVF